MQAGLRSFHAEQLKKAATSKKLAMHVAFLCLMATIAWQSRVAFGLDRTSLLYTLISGEEVIEGPLDPSAYAQTEGPGIGGARLAAIDAGNSGLDLITFEDPEVIFSQTLGGTAVVAPLQPLVPEPGSQEGNEGSTRSRQASVYTVEEGDTIASIAAKFDISSNTILWANGLSSSNTLKVGDHLTILPVTGVLHTVKSGDTVLAVANKYDADAKELVEFNGLSDSSKLSIGQKLIVPDGYIAPASTPTISNQRRIAETPSSDGPTPAPSASSGSGFVWPTTTKHISQYFRWGHTGIDIDNRSRPPVYAASGGTVEFTGWLGGYGNLVIVNHGGGMQTYYAHNDKFYVSKGQTVTKGQAIAQMGSTGRSTGPHVHFEVRRNGAPINPLSMY